MFCHIGNSFHFFSFHCALLFLLLFILLRLQLENNINYAFIKKLHRHTLVGQKIEDLHASFLYGRQREWKKEREWMKTMIFLYVVSWDSQNIEAKIYVFNNCIYKSHTTYKKKKITRSAMRRFSFASFPVFLFFCFFGPIYIVSDVHIS